MIPYLGLTEDAIHIMNVSCKVNLPIISYRISPVHINNYELIGGIVGYLGAGRLVRDNMLEAVPNFPIHN